MQVVQSSSSKLKRAPCTYVRPRKLHFAGEERGAEGRAGMGSRARSCLATTPQPIPGSVTHRPSPPAARGSHLAGRSSSRAARRWGRSLGGTRGRCRRRFQPAEQSRARRGHGEASVCPTNSSPAPQQGLAALDTTTVTILGSCSSREENGFVFVTLSTTGTCCGAALPKHPPPSQPAAPILAPTPQLWSCLPEHCDTSPKRAPGADKAQPEASQQCHEGWDPRPAPSPPPCSTAWTHQAHAHGAVAI